MHTPLPYHSGKEGRRTAFNFYRLPDNLASGVVATTVWFGHQYWRLLAWFFTPVVASSIGDRIVQVLALLLLGVGTVVLARRDSCCLLFTLGPGLLLTPTTVLHLYPFNPQSAGRLTLYLVPLASTLTAGGLGYLAQLGTSAGWRGATALLALALAGWGLYPLLADRSLPNLPREELRDLVRSELVPNLRPGDSVYVYYAAVDAFQYYAPELRPAVTPDWHALGTFDRDRVHVWYGGARWGIPYDLSAELMSTTRATGSSERLWIVLSHVEPGDEQTLTAGVSRCGLIEQVWRQPGAPLYQVRAGTELDAC